MHILHNFQENKEENGLKGLVRS